MISEQREFWSKVAQNYDRVADLQVGGQTRSMVRDRLAREGPLGNAVEFGCGTGFCTETLAGKADRVIATDLSPGMLDLARSRVRAANVSFQTEDCHRTSLPDCSFDTALMSLVIHFTESRETLKEMHRILRPGALERHCVHRLASATMLDCAPCGARIESTLRHRGRMK